MSVRLLPVVLALLALLAPALGQDVRGQDLPAPQQPEGPIQQVVLDGQVGVNEDLIRANLKTRAGDLYDPAKVDADVRWLADAQGILSEVSVDAGPVVRFRLSRIRRYDELRFEGNEHWSAEELFTTARVTAGKSASPDEVRSARELVRDRYLQAGFAFVQADVSTRLDEGGRRLAVLRVFEGPRVETDEVRIVGLTALEDGDALRVMRSPPGFWAWLVGKDFVRSELDADIVLLENFVRGEGYLDGRVALERLDWSEDRTEVTVTMRVDEGPRYTVRELKLDGVTAIPEAELLALSPIHTGSPWRRPDVWRTLRAWRELYGKSGYLDAEITPVETYDETEPFLDVTWRVREGAPKSVRDVLIRGNHGTRDDVVRRELTVKPGDVANTTELAWSEDVLVSKGWFTDFSGEPRVNVSTQPAPDPAQVDVTVDVDDETSGLFTFLVGAGSDSGLFAGVSVDKRNFDITRPPEHWTDLFAEFFGQGEAFHGGGQRLLLNVMPGTETTEIDILFQDPWLNPTGEKPWGMSAELYAREREFDDYDRAQRGAWLNFDHRLTRQASIDFGFRHEVTNIDHLSAELTNGPGVSNPIEAAEGRTATQSVDGGFSWRNLDSLVEPTRGFAGTVRLESAGSPLGGDVDFFREQATGEWYWKMFEDSDGHPTVLHPRFALGHVSERGSTDELPFFENFFVGGSSGPFALRGFDFQGVGPHISGNALGDRSAAVVSLEALYPLVSRYNPFRDEDETLLKTVIFAEAGNLASHMGDLDKDWRSSAGAGMRLRIPALGGVTLSLDYAFIVNSQEGDEERALSFELSRRF